MLKSMMQRLFRPGLLSFFGLILALLICLWLFPQSHAFVIAAWQGLMLLGLSAFWLFFAVSLLPQRIPLITRYAWLIDGTMDEPKRRYTRRVTWAWVALLGWLWLNKLQIILPDPACSVCLPLSIWSDLFGLLLMLGLLGGEFLLRKRLFADQSQARLGVFLWQLVQTPLSAIWRFQPPADSHEAKRQTS